MLSKLIPNPSPAPRHTPGDACRFKYSRADITPPASNTATSTGTTNEVSG
jgi:hypothetical protein